MARETAIVMDRPARDPFPANAGRTVGLAGDLQPGQDQVGQLICWWAGTAHPTRAGVDA
jgi:hypothetical protein